MSAPAAIARANGAQSRGPVTSEGKQRSSQNSLKHGLTSQTVVLPHESQDDFNELESSYRETYNPANAVQNDLLQEMVNARWRLKRIQEMEHAVIQKAIREQSELLPECAPAAEARALAYAELAESKSFRMLARYAAQLRRAYEKARKELLELQAVAQNEESQNEPMLALTPQLLDVLFTPPRAAATTEGQPQLQHPRQNSSATPTNAG